MGTPSLTSNRSPQPNILILCMDQWQTHMAIPEGVTFPAMQRLEARGVSFERHYCTVPLCTPSRATMWTGLHAVHTGAYENTNYAWIEGLSREIPTIGHLLREQGYYTAFKGKWHLSWLDYGEDTLEPYGFSDYQQWGEMYGRPLEGHMLDGTVAFETVDWLETKAPTLNQPWLMVCNLVNPMTSCTTCPIRSRCPRLAAPRQASRRHQQRLGWFDQTWERLPAANLNDDLALQPYGVHAYRDSTDYHYGRVPDDQPDLWLRRRNLSSTACAWWMPSSPPSSRRSTGRVVGQHGGHLYQRPREMNGAHAHAAKGAIHYEATIVNLTVCARRPLGASARP